MLNLDYLINAKRLAFRFFRSYEPRLAPFGGSAYLPGSPGNIPFGYHNMVTRLTTIVSNNMVNELHVSYQRDTLTARANPPAAITPPPLWPASGPRLAGRRSSVQPCISIPGQFQAGGGVHNFLLIISRLRSAISSPGTSGNKRFASAAR